MKHYVRIHYAAPEMGGELLNVAELEEVSETQCTMVRMIELDPDEKITGIFADGHVIGQANKPLGMVPHPRTYDQFEGISSTQITREQFEGLWEEAQQKLGR